MKTLLLILQLTLPPSDPFWDKYLPPNGWNCRCTVVQVRKGKYPTSDPELAMQRGDNCTAKPKQQIFRFNPGKSMKVFPEKHPYFPKGCGGCPLRLTYNAGSEQCRACKILQKCWKEKVRTESNRERLHYMHEMEPLLKKKVVVNGNGHNMTVKFNKMGNKHLYSDTFCRTNTVQKEDLKDLDKLLANAKFIKKSGLSKPRKDEVKRFYYYEAQLHGRTVYLNVAETDIYTNKKGLSHNRFLYSVTDSIK